MLQTDPLILGQRIAGLRRAHGWSQRRLAEAAGVSHGYVAQLELGRVPSPSKFRLDAVARALDLRTSDALVAPALPHSAEASALPEAGARYESRTLEERVRAARAARNGAPLSARAQTAAFGAARTSPASALDPDGLASTNVLGGLDQIRSSGARPLPVFRWGSCGDPRDRESPPDPDHLEYPPPGRETLVGPNGFGVVVKGDSMSGRGIFDGDVVWVNPERPYQIGKVVLALVTDVSGDSGMVVKTYTRSDVGECLMSESPDGRSPVVCSEFKIIGPVVGISSWRLPL